MAKTITVIGLGPGDISGISLGAMEELRSGKRIYLRTAIHPAVDGLRNLGISFTSFDDIYESAPTFSDVYEEIAASLLRAAVHEDVLYAVPGHPLMAEQSVQILVSRATSSKEVAIRFGPGQSFLDVVCTRLGVDPIEGMALFDGTALEEGALSPSVNTFIAQVYNRSVASDVKLALMEVFPDDYEVTVVRAAGVAGEERIVKMPLFELDRTDWIDHLTTVFVPATSDEAILGRTARRVTDIVRILRAPDGCPWDRKQTHATLRRYVLEEAHEVAEAIDMDDSSLLCDELGDLLLQVLLHSQIAHEHGDFSIRDVYGALADKLVRRHPHVFGGVDAKSVQDAQRSWDAAKANELKDKDPSVISKVKRAQPVMRYTTELQQAAAKVGFDWTDLSGAVSKLGEEIREFEEELQSGTGHDAAAAELGDLIFSAVNVARWLEVDAEDVLRATARKFEARFRIVEQLIRGESRDWSDYSPEELDMLWKKAKIQATTSAT